MFDSQDYFNDFSFFPDVDVSKPSVTWKDAPPGSHEFRAIETWLRFVGLLTPRSDFASLGYGIQSSLSLFSLSLSVSLSLFLSLLRRLEISHDPESSIHVKIVFQYVGASRAESEVSAGQCETDREPVSEEQSEFCGSQSAND